MSFDREGFRTFLVGSRNISEAIADTYIRELTNMENRFLVDIDKQYGEDCLLSVLSMIDGQESYEQHTKDSQKTYVNRYKEFKVSTMKMWMFSPGENACHWEFDLLNQCMSGNWQTVFPLTHYNSKEELHSEGTLGAKDPSIIMAFKSVKSGDYVLARNGNSKIIGLGIVVGEYQYDDNTEGYKHYYEVKWEIIDSYDFAISRYGQYKPTIFALDPVEIDAIISKYSDIRSLLNNFIISKQENNNDDDDLIAISSNNTILCGPPGTGKTYNAVKYAVKICEPGFKSLKGTDKERYTDYLREYKRLKDEGRIQFTTFHQSYGYEEFIEGIKPMINDEDHDEKDYIKYKIENGVFKSFCDDSRFASAWEKLVLLARTRGELIVDLQSTDRKLAWNKENNRFEVNVDGLEYHITRDMVNDFRKSIYKRKDNNGTDSVEYYTSDAILEFMKKEGLYKCARNKSSIVPCVFIIDEINRGNISKIFGELITLIEDSKREGNREAMSVELPYSSSVFSVPNNVYILGTMNTADRSIAMMDTALRRRFQFIEKMPKPERLKEITNDNGNLKIDMEEMLKTINNRIEVLYDREHTIGHAYFININTFEELKDVFLNRIIPLLQEYFYDDYEKISLVLGDNQKGVDKYSFVTERKNNDLFGNNHDYDEDKCFGINIGAFSEFESYVGIYESIITKTDSETPTDSMLDMVSE